MKWTVLIAMLLTWVSIGSATEEIIMDLPGGVQMEFVWIDTGEVVTGSSSSEQGRSSDESPQREVVISEGYYLGKYEVTQGQWEAVMGTEPWLGLGYVQSNPNHPAVYISRDDVQAFVHALNQAAEDSLYRLPTEVEWEYACRAGTTTRWSFGDDVKQLGDYAWFRDNAWDAVEQYAHEVGTKKPNPWGLYDMHGNVWEWVQDQSGIIRGGYFYSDARYTRSAMRIAYGPSMRCGIGARLLKIK